MPSEPACATIDRPALVSRHKSFRGLKVEQDMLSQFTMYVVELDQLGLFMSDSRPEAFDLAFNALFQPEASLQMR